MPASEKEKASILGADPQRDDAPIVGWHLSLAFGVQGLLAFGSGLPLVGILCQLGYRRLEGVKVGEWKCISLSNNNKSPSNNK